MGVVAPGGNNNNNNNILTRNRSSGLLRSPGPDLATAAQLLSFNRTQTRAVIGLVAGHNTLKRHLHVMGLNDNPTCRKCGTEEETSVHVLCE